MKYLRSLPLALILTAALIVPLSASPASSGTSKTEDPPPSNGVREQMRIIVLSGVAGGIFGLSTLSFYGRPQDYLDNVIGGFCVGILVGSVYSFYSVTTKPKETFGSQEFEQLENNRFVTRTATPLHVGWTFEY